MAGERAARELPLPGGDFRLFVTRLSLQAMMSLGMIENPITKTRAVNLDHARMLIDDLRMLQEKSYGNLEPEEDEHLAKVVRDLAFALERAASQEPRAE
jgi:hypothetical protein